MKDVYCTQCKKTVGISKQKKDQPTDIIEVICHQCNQLNKIGSKIPFKMYIGNRMMASEVMEMIEDQSGIEMPEDDYEKFYKSPLYEVEFNGELDLKTGKFDVESIRIHNDTFIKRDD